MPAKTNTRIVLHSRPKGPIEPDTFKTDHSEAVPTEKDLKDGEVVVRVMWISLVSRSSPVEIIVDEADEVVMLRYSREVGRIDDHLA